MFLYYFYDCFSVIMAEDEKLHSCIMASPVDMGWTCFMHDCAQLLNSTTRHSHSFHPLLYLFFSPSLLLYFHSSARFFSFNFLLFIYFTNICLSLSVTAYFPDDLVAFYMVLPVQQKQISQK